MPIIRYRNNIAYYAHVPKCGGSAIEAFLSEIDGLRLAFLDQKYVIEKRSFNWNLTSPQHVDSESMRILFPEEFFDFQFVIVRNPLQKAISAFNWHKYIERNINRLMPLDFFIKNILPYYYKKKGWMDNHFLPQKDFILPNPHTKIFKLENNGVQEAKLFLMDRLALKKVSTSEKKVNKALKENKRDTKVSKKARDIVSKLYEKDYEEFGYSR
ncbi:sulfotransferase family 2 domain-containing protein [Aestuariibacter salexigens]|uniref:sulfotransferase family 2 domain-containing protein n=1 Tax=Aestuariibacter salexigens TaxID=226010 RepID=UPI00047A5BE6|nr:sulfotransferase family 2 domain-containing protein [Aestuariibacter salexigens]